VGQIDICQMLEFADGNARGIGIRCVLKPTKDRVSTRLKRVFRPLFTPRFRTHDHNCVSRHG
ncbi:MAG: hypothetical protein QF590_06760, partial [Dehalococcoidia bacterium]|nr:hypothetical protein [Dehalococcoidia bacterium]